MIACSACSDKAPSSDPIVTTSPDAMVVTTPSGDAGMPVSLAALRFTLQGPTRLEPNETSTITAIGIFDDASELDLTRAAAWHTSSSTTVEVQAGGVVTAIGPGQAQLWASRAQVQSNRVRVSVEAQGELRGVWVTRWTFSSASDVQRVVDDVERGHLNAIFFQVRGVADAYYQSSLEPWAARLTGTLGQDPGWDPLAEVIRLAHPRGIQVHAWLNTFPAWSGTSAPTESTPRHAMLEHPEWLCADDNGAPMPLGGDGYQFFSPGNPQVRLHIASVAEELMTRYPIDGIHFDFVRYPGRNYCHDSVSEAEFATAKGAEPSLTFEAFQRDRITLLLADVRGRMQRVRRTVAISVASWGIYQNIFGWSGVSRGYDDYFQDAHHWAREGIVDALVPMAYWRLTNPKGGRTDFAALAEHHIGAATDGGRFAFMGISAGHDTAEVLEQVRVARDSGARGMVFFELGQLRDHLDALAQGPFVEVTPPPVMGWK